MSREKRTRLSLVWIVPIVAAIAGGWVAATRILGEGPEITHRVQDRRGPRGRQDEDPVQRRRGRDDHRPIRLSHDHQQVIATAQMAPKTDGLPGRRHEVLGGAAAHLGRQRDGAGHADLRRLHRHGDRQLEGSAARASSGSRRRRVVTGDVPGRFFVLKAPTWAPSTRGTPIFFRRLQVGQVVSYELDEDGKSLTVKVFVKAPYDQYVNAGHALLAGERHRRVALRRGPRRADAVGPLDPGRRHRVRDRRARTRCCRPPRRTPSSRCSTTAPRPSCRRRAIRQDYVLVFKESVRGLEPGAPVEFRGIRLGQVVDVDAQVDAKTFEFSVAGHDPARSPAARA